MFRTFLTTVLLSLSCLVAQAAVDANKASAKELEALKGIGPALSAKIVKARTDAPFRNWDDMMKRVSGVGPATAARLSTQGFTVAGAAYAATDAVAAASTARAANPAPRPATVTVAAAQGRAPTASTTATPSAAAAAPTAPAAQVATRPQAQGAAVAAAPGK
jgi:competence protein ComEA